MDEHSRLMRNGRKVRNIVLIVTSALVLPRWPLQAADPPPQLLKKIAEREAATQHARDQYTYRQTVTIQEFDDHGTVTGQYRDARDIIFSPTHVRYENVDGQPRNTLTRIKLTEQDFADIRDVHPFLLTPDEVPLYEGRYKGEEIIEGTPCFVEQLRPKQIFSEHRYFEGLIWVRESDLSIIKSEGQPVPQIETLREQNLFPHFTTFRRDFDGKWSFPIETYSDDTLFFRSRAQRIRIVVRYLNYKQFGVDSKITFDEKPSPPK